VTFTRAAASVFTSSSVAATRPPNTSDRCNQPSHPRLRSGEPTTDAHAYCALTGCRPRPNGSTPPRGGLDQARYPWGDELTPGGEHWCNIWQGRYRVAARTTNTPDSTSGNTGFCTAADLPAR
jgi:hypothetical protein